MSGKYVPPSRREGYKPVTTELPPGYRPPRGQQVDGDGTATFVPLIAKIFDTPLEGTFNYFDYNCPTPVTRFQGRGTRPYNADQTPETTSSPLSPPSPARHPLAPLIAYIVMFGSAHPLWESHHELWSHTNADKLIEDEKGLKKNFGRPLPVFQSNGNKEERSSVPGFVGWWVLDKIRIVQPRSEELLDLHYSKARVKAVPNIRTPASWSDTLDRIWVKSRFVPVDITDARYANLPDPITLESGEGARAVLEAGDLREELRIWEEEVPDLKIAVESYRQSQK